MAEKRNDGRYRKRVMVKYGVSAPDKTGFSKNVSSHGLHVQTNMPLKPGLTVQLEMKFPDRTFDLWARVVWARKVPPQLAHSLPCGMGLQFIDPPEDWLEFFRKLVA